MATIIESPDIIQKTIVVPQAALDMCKAQNIPTSGNCAGKSGAQVLNTAECNNTPSDDDWGYASLFLPMFLANIFLVRSFPDPRLEEIPEAS
jgi:hypothetical protein